jgi:hypothetical protein
VREGPIIFDGESVRGILAGRKVQTRRVVKPQPARVDDQVLIFERPFKSRGNVVHVNNMPLASPYGGPGDKLWIREAWRVTNWMNEDPEVKVRYEADGSARWVEIPEEADWDGEIHTKLWIQSCDDMEAAGYWWDAALEDEAKAEWKGEGPEPEVLPTRVRSGLYLYRWASRILLEVKAVRVERLQDITEADALAEGMTWEAFKSGTAKGRDARESFQIRWDEINAKRGPWKSNPWAWVIEFGIDKVLGGPK